MYFSLLGIINIMKSDINHLTQPKGNLLNTNNEDLVNPNLDTFVGSFKSLAKFPFETGFSFDATLAVVV